MLSDRRIKREFKRLFMKEFKKEPEEEVYKFGEEFVILTILFCFSFKK